MGCEPKREDNGVNGEEVSPPHPTLGLAERCELSQLGPGLSPGRKWFYCNLISTDRLC